MTIMTSFQVRPRASWDSHCGGGHWLLPPEPDQLWQHLPWRGLWKMSSTTVTPGDRKFLIGMQPKEIIWSLCNFIERYPLQGSTVTHGDKATGPNHVLPTRRVSRYSSFSLTLSWWQITTDPPLSLWQSGTLEACPWRSSWRSSPGRSSPLSQTGPHHHHHHYHHEYHLHHHHDKETISSLLSWSPVYFVSQVNWTEGSSHFQNGRNGRTCQVIIVSIITIIVITSHARSSSSPLQIKS